MTGPLLRDLDDLAEDLFGATRPAAFRSGACGFRFDPAQGVRWRFSRADMAPPSRWACRWATNRNELSGIRYPRAEEKAEVLRVIDRWIFDRRVVSGPKDGRRLCLRPEAELQAAVGSGPAGNACPYYFVRACIFGAAVQARAAVEWYTRVVGQQNEAAGDLAALRRSLHDGDREFLVEASPPSCGKVDHVRDDARSRPARWEGERNFLWQVKMDRLAAAAMSSRRDWLSRRPELLRDIEDAQRRVIELADVPRRSEDCAEVAAAEVMSACCFALTGQRMSRGNKQGSGFEPVIRAARMLIFESRPERVPNDVVDVVWRRFEAGRAWIGPEWRLVFDEEWPRHVATRLAEEVQEIRNAGRDRLFAAVGAAALE